MARKPRTPAPRAQKAPLMQRLRNDFLTGLVILAPVTLTLWVVWTAVTFIDARIVPLVPAVYNPSTYIGYDIAGFGVIVFLIVTTIVGALAKGYIGRRFIRWGESVVDRTPIVRSIYNAVKQIFETVFSGNSASFSQACLIEYPRKGVWGVGFLARETASELPDKTGRRLYAVFVPTTPNPTSGFLIYVPVEDVVILDMSIEEAAKMIISGGLVEPPPRGRQPRTAVPSQAASAPGR
jgi:uncharacterized membrane protein